MSKREDRRLARRYSHQTPWRPCYQMMRGPCLRCWVREVTGINKRAKTAHIIQVRNALAKVDPIVFWRDTEGRWERRG